MAALLSSILTDHLSLRSAVNLMNLLSIIVFSLLMKTSNIRGSGMDTFGKTLVRSIWIKYNPLPSGSNHQNTFCSSNCSLMHCNILICP